MNELTTTISPVPALVTNTPFEDHRAAHSLLVKREDLSAPAPWPPFAKTRGVLSWMQKRVAEGQRLFGVLDTYHSQGGLAVSAAGAHLGVDVVNYFPVYAAEQDHTNHNFWPKELRWQQAAAQRLGAELVGLKAGRSAVIYHQAKRDCEVGRGGLMYPNALKLDESVEETAREVALLLAALTDAQYIAAKSMPWIVPASSGTLAAGVLKGLADHFHEDHPPLILHMGYSRSHGAVLSYVQHKAGVVTDRITVVDEDYSYKDTARPGETPPWPCNQYYDLKAYRWWMREGRKQFGEAVFWNIG